MHLATYKFLATLTLALLPAHIANCQVESFFNSKLIDSTVGISPLVGVCSTTTLEKFHFPRTAFPSFFDQSGQNDFTIAASLAGFRNHCCLDFLASANNPSACLASLIKNSEQKYLVTRWPGRLDSIDTESSEFQLITQASFLDVLERPSNDHIDLIWNGRNFELHQFYFRQARCTFGQKKFTLSRTIEMEILVLSSELILIPANTPILFSYSVVLDQFRNATLKHVHLQ